MGERNRQPWRLGPGAVRWFDGMLTVLLALPIPVYWTIGLVEADGVLAEPVLIGLLGAAQTVPLWWRRHRPVAVFAVVAGASALQVLALDEVLWSQLAFPIALYSVARFASALPGLVALTVGVVAAAVAAIDWLLGYGGEVTGASFASYFLTMAGIVVSAWALGTLGRTRQAYVDALVERGERLEREAAQQAALAAIEERNRIAREMHDVVAHGLTTIVVQADGARAAVAHDPAVAAPALATIASSGREAIAELRRMLGVLRAGDVATTPQPRLPDLADLVEGARASGMRVRVDLPAPLPTVSDGVALTAYRVVQEALSNVRKHAGPGAAVDVQVRPAEGLADGIVVEVTDDGHGAAAGGDGRGLGLPGMRERVAAHGGDLQVGPRPGGGFAVRARIPL